MASTSLSDTIKKLGWKSYLGIGVFCFIYWYLLPLQSEYYLGRDLIEFNLQETLIILGVVFLILFLLIYRFLYDENDTFIRVAQSFAYAVFFSFFYFFAVHQKVIDLALLTNRVMSTEQVIEPFKITYIKGNSVGVKSLEDSYHEILENKFEHSDLEQFKEGDYINIILDKGIFGKNYITSKKIKIQPINP